MMGFELKYVEQVHLLVCFLVALAGHYAERTLSSSMKHSEATVQRQTEQCVLSQFFCPPGRGIQITDLGILRTPPLLGDEAKNSAGTSGTPQRHKVSSNGSYMTVPCGIRVTTEGCTPFSLFVNLPGGEIRTGYRSAGRKTSLKALIGSIMGGVINLQSESKLTDYRMLEAYVVWDRMGIKSERTYISTETRRHAVCKAGENPYSSVHHRSVGSAPFKRDTEPTRAKGILLINENRIMRPKDMRQYPIYWVINRELLRYRFSLKNMFKKNLCVHGTCRTNRSCFVTSIRCHTGRAAVGDAIGCL